MGRYLPGRHYNRPRYHPPPIPECTIAVRSIPGQPGVYDDTGRQFAGVADAIAWHRGRARRRSALTLAVTLVAIPVSWLAAAAAWGAIGGLGGLVVAALIIVAGFTVPVVVLR